MTFFHWLALLAFVGLVFFLFKNWSILKPSRRRIVLFLCTFLSLIYFLPVANTVNQTTRTTSFCLRCHVMEQYGESIHKIDDEIIASVHFRNNYIPQKQGCYSCHSDYFLFQDIETKIRGMKHIFVQTTGNIPKKLKLYNPYPNESCLSCHRDSEKYNKNSNHHLKRTPLADINSGKVGCMVKGCHDVPHFYPERMGK